MHIIYRRAYDKKNRQWPEAFTWVCAFLAANAFLINHYDHHLDFCQCSRSRASRHLFRDGYDCFECSYSSWLCGEKVPEIDATATNTASPLDIPFIACWNSKVDGHCCRFIVLLRPRNAWWILTTNPQLSATSSSWTYAASASVISPFDNL